MRKSPHSPTVADGAAQEVMCETDLPPPMVLHTLWTRRHLLCAFLTGVLAGSSLHAQDILELDWEDLLPAGESARPAIPQGFVSHDVGILLGQQPLSTGVREDWNGKIIRLPGFVVPIDYSGTGVTLFILVPYVGACIHVPPPPANQLVLVIPHTPYEIEELFDPVYVTGTFDTAPTSTELAEIGYILSAATVKPYVY